MMAVDPADVEVLPPRLIGLAHTPSGDVVAIAELPLFNGEALHRHHLHPKG